MQVLVFLEPPVPTAKKEGDILIQVDKLRSQSVNPLI